MKLIIPDRTNPNCYVFQMGYTYPVQIYNRYDYDRARIRLQQSVLGDYVNECYYWSPGRLKPFWQSRENSRWYAGQRLWKHRQNPKSDFWIVFRSERDRTLALMLLQEVV